LVLDSILYSTVSDFILSFCFFVYIYIDDDDSFLRSHSILFPLLIVQHTHTHIYNIVPPTLSLTTTLQISRWPESILAPERPETEMGFPSALTSRPFSHYISRYLPTALLLRMRYHSQYDFQHATDFDKCTYIAHGRWHFVAPHTSGHITAVLYKYIIIISHLMTNVKIWACDSLRYGTLLYYYTDVTRHVPWSIALFCINIRAGCRKIIERIIFVQTPLSGLVILRWENSGYFFLFCFRPFSTQHLNIRLKFAFRAVCLMGTTNAKNICDPDGPRYYGFFNGFFCYIIVQNDFPTNMMCLKSRNYSSPTVCYPR